MKKPMTSKTWQTGPKTNKAREALKAKAPVKEETPPIEEPKVEKDLTMEVTETMEKAEDDAPDLETFSQKFVKPEFLENQTTGKNEDDLSITIPVKEAVSVLQKWCSGRDRANLIIGANELATLVVLGASDQRMGTAKIDKIAGNIISGGEKVFTSQPYLNRLVELNAVSKKPIEGTRSFGYALTDIGVELTKALIKLEPPATE